MQVKTLIKKLQKMPQSKDVCILGDTNLFMPVQEVKLECLSMVEKGICETTGDYPQKWAVLLKN